jgi:hypothetical protein
MISKKKDELNISKNKIEQSLNIVFYTDSYDMTLDRDDLEKKIGDFEFNF